MFIFSVLKIHKVFFCSDDFRLIASRIQLPHFHAEHNHQGNITRNFDLQNESAGQILESKQDSYHQVPNKKFHQSQQPRGFPNGSYQRQLAAIQNVENGGHNVNDFLQHQAYINNFRRSSAVKTSVSHEFMTPGDRICDPRKEKQVLPKHHATTKAPRCSPTSEKLAYNLSSSKSQRVFSENGSNVKQSPQTILYQHAPHMPHPQACVNVVILGATEVQEVEKGEGSIHGEMSNSAGDLGSLQRDAENIPQQV